MRVVEAIGRTPQAALSERLDHFSKPAVALAATAIHGILYLLPNHLRLAEARSLPLTSIDLAIPFVPDTFWIYWSDYLLIFAAFSACTRPGTTLRFVKALLLVVVLGTFVHWVFPVAYPREAFLLPEDTGLVPRQALLWFRELDSPASCMPSLHVAASFLAALSCPRARPRLKLGLLAWASAVAAATLTTKQHYLVDVVAGLGLAVAVWWVFYRDSRSEQTL